MRLPVGISTAAKLAPTPEENDWLDGLPRPRRLLLIGGNTFMWKLTPETVAEAASDLRRKCERDSGSVIAVSSSRSSRAVQKAVAKALDGSRHGLVWGGFPRYGVLLHAADEVYVTADSVAMTSDAVATGKPVGLILPEKSLSGRLFYGLAKAGVPVPIRDVERFWSAVHANGLAGDMAKPVAGKLDLDPLATVVSAVRSLLNR
jgi:mitochondrial fission protein ELM1